MKYLVHRCSLLLILLMVGSIISFGQFNINILRGFNSSSPSIAYKITQNNQKFTGIGPALSDLINKSGEYDLGIKVFEGNSYSKGSYLMHVVINSVLPMSMFDANGVVQNYAVLNGSITFSDVENGRTLFVKTINLKSTDTYVNDFDKQIYEIITKNVLLQFPFLEEVYKVLENKTIYVQYPNRQNYINFYIYKVVDYYEDSRIAVFHELAILKKKKDEPNIYIIEVDKGNVAGELAKGTKLYFSPFQIGLNR